MGTRKKKSDEQPKFKLSKDAQECRAEFARKADAKKVLEHSCSQTKLEVLRHQINNPEVIDWLSKRLKQLIKIHNYGNIPIDGSYDEEDDQQELFIDISKKTIPRKIESGEWLYFLSAYLQEAISGFLANYRKKHKARGGKVPRMLNEMIDSDAPIEHLSKKARSGSLKGFVRYLEINSWPRLLPGT